MDNYKPPRKGGSEFNGRGVERSGVHGKGMDALSASDRLRLIYRTGQDCDSTAKPSKRSRQGLKEKPESVVDTE